MNKPKKNLPAVFVYPEKLDCNFFDNNYHTKVVDGIAIVDEFKTCSFVVIFKHCTGRIKR